jgi:membrane protease YdiL (CAAX protease family)
LGSGPIYLVGAFLPLALFLTQKGPIVPVWVVGIVGLYVLLAGAIGEEYFYRVLLQTRLERLSGRWNGIALSAVLFGFFHLPLHYATLQIASGSQAVPQFFLILAGIFANQVVIGFFFGFLWSRYRNGWMNVAVHLVYDAITTILILSGA